MEFNWRFCFKSLLRNKRMQQFSLRVHTTVCVHVCVRAWVYLIWCSWVPQVSLYEIGRVNVNWRFGFVLGVQSTTLTFSHCNIPDVCLVFSLCSTVFYEHVELPLWRGWRGLQKVCLYGKAVEMLGEICATVSFLALGTGDGQVFRPKF